MRFNQWLNLHLALYACLLSRPQHGKEGYRHEASYYSAWLVLRGEAQAEVEGVGLARAHPGQWLICPPGWRVQRFPPDTELLSLAFHAFWLGGEPFFGPGLPVVLEASDHPRLQRIVERMDRAIERHVPGHTFFLSQQDFPVEGFLNIQQHLPRFMTELIHILRGVGVEPCGVSPMDDRVSKAVSLLDGLPLSAPCSMAEIARRCGLSRPHLDRLFQLQIGHSPREHFNRRRLLRARHALVEPSVQVQEVAYSLGFRSLSHFHRWFKGATGQSPREYQKQHAGRAG